jgi:abortive infection bacteriophage resistance protein
MISHRFFSFKEVFIISKPYKSTEELVNQLRNRNLKIDKDTKKLINREGYYSIINGYKDLFLISKEPDLYMPGSHFNDIYTLFMLDRELRFLMLRKLIKIEQRIKSSVCRVFSSNFRTAEAYLNRNSYTNYPQKSEKINKLIYELNNKRSSNKAYLSHYKDKHKEIPIWVLANNLTFGNIKNFYLCLDLKLQRQIAKDLTESITKPYSNKSIFPKDLKKIIIVATHFRNICAHDERFFSEKAVILNYNHPENNLYYSFYEMYNLISALLLPTENYFLEEKLKYLIEHEFKFSEDSIKFRILEEMGFPRN